MGGASLETFSGEAQLKKSPCMLWPSGDVQKSKRLRREAGESEEEAENELKQKVGRT